jgi:hypothetical protein
MREACIGFWLGNLRERVHWGDPGAGGKIILRWIFRKLDVEWIQLAQDSDRWRGLVNAVMNLWVPYNTGNFLTCCKPVSFSRRTMLCEVSK